MYFCIRYISGKVSYTVSAYLNKLNHGIYLPKLEDRYSRKRETKDLKTHFGKSGRCSGKKQIVSEVCELRA